MNGHILYVLRISCGLSQADVAKLSGYTASYISKLENGRAIMDGKTAQRLRSVFTQLDDAQIRVIVAVHDSIKPLGTTIQATV
ncbi:MAG: helix-turn-helix domain-containing protein [Sporolactobacillus sp.]|jgi:transcriptional regulator with XRE-family HTH domain|nr:helix-turn-helix domain-containing protein [Sporolactobacillus sp.]